ncbi:hypothetical protein AMK59_3074 [Oryctes borbonicus]|uniref:COMM domain-containing protein 3 n=1 Tax=Oryctes borbonicus TaxID=1629725 RepID=A0A0T6B4V7_9SCAR|nr:hypothetical protein AMK59_3074 [Oryctes borbonicus]
MNLCDDLKKSLNISNNSNVINDQIYKNLLECSFNELIRDQNVSNGVQSIQHSKPDIIKELHASFLKIIAQFAQNNLTRDNVQSILTTDCNFNVNRANFFCDLYEMNKTRLQIILGNIGTHLPHIIDVKWNIDHVVKTSGIDESEGPIFRICLLAESYNEEKQSNDIEKINFSCTSQELQDLVYRLKEAVRHCQKIAAGH